MFKFWTKQNYTWSRKWLFFLCIDFFWQPYCDHKTNIKSCPFIFLVVHCICKWLNLVVCIDLQKHQMYLFQCASRSRYTLLLTAHFISRKNLWDETNALSHVWELQQEGVLTMKYYKLRCYTWNWNERSIPRHEMLGVANYLNGTNINQCTSLIVPNVWIMHDH